MNQSDLFQLIIDHKDENLPFVVFSEPYSEILNVKLQNDDKLHLNFDLNCGAFVFAPFDSDKFDKIY